ncbi:MAG: IMP cyclohydrolase [Desulfovibrionaceae bacterium]
MELLPIRRALLSVTDKSGLVDFATYLTSLGVELVSTGGTRRMLADAGLAVTAVSEVTGFPEILGGRVKTLHPHIHAGVLADKDDPAHMETLRSLSIKPFDLVCVNLYDFASAAAKNLGLKDAVEQIDIGGPTLLRASAKNFHSILVVPSPSHYAAVRQELAANGGRVALELRRRMAVETFRATSRYDAMIADYLAAHKA